MQNKVQKSSRLRTVIEIVIVFIFVLFMVFTWSSSFTIVTDGAYPTVDSIPCTASEGTAYHVHALLVVYIDGKQLQVPQGVGIAKNESCLYWLHTHDTSGVIHIESPKIIFPTLRDFLDIWKKEFGTNSYNVLLNEHGTISKWVVYVNGNLYRGDFYNISLNPHTIITLLYNSPDTKPVTTFNWANL